MNRETLLSTLSSFFEGLRMVEIGESMEVLWRDHVDAEDLKGVMIEIIRDHTDRARDERALEEEARTNA
jgi:hypothetical protein